VEPTASTATHSSTTAGRSHVGKQSGRDQRCRTEKTKLIGRGEAAFPELRRARLVEWPSRP
jgi:hypothetical protein